MEVMAKGAAAGALLIGSTLLAGCSSAPPKSAADLDSAYGIPPSSVPSELERPDGMLKNGLLPAQPYDGS